VEFVHPHKKATFNQRELGSDYNTFSTGLRAALRQAPKVILVGEMRDRETVEIGMSAAETGHLVMTTLHTVDAGQTINRIIGMFPQEEEQQIRIRLADTLRWVICQRLVPKVGGGRIAILEIMQANMRVRDVVMNGESEGKTIYEIITNGAAYGMFTFDQHIIKLYREGKISEDTAMAYGSRKAVVGRGIDAVKSGRGEKTTDIEDLDMDEGYEKGGKPGAGKLKKKR
jgi:twitching motility protein PilT